MGWSVDYKRLAEYLKLKYGCRNLYYFGGIMVDEYKHDYMSAETVDLQKLIRFLRSKMKKLPAGSRAHKTIDSYVSRAKFYKKLQDFGYTLVLRPTKVYRQPDGSKRLKANCDLEMALSIIKDIEKYERALVLTSDGDFLPVLKFVKHKKKDVMVLGRGVAAAKELKQFAGANFRDFVTLRSKIERTK